MLTERIDFLGVGFDLVTMDDVLNRLSRVTSKTPYAYIVTPNVDHVVRLDAPAENLTLAPIYDDADLCVCDSRVLKLLAGLHGLNLPLVPGSDLSVRLFKDIIRPHDRIAVVGGSGLLMEQLGRLFPTVIFTHYSAPMGLRHNAIARRHAADFVAAAQARFIFVAVGSPQQEMIAAAVRGRPEATGVALCIGASLEFVTGQQRRAPRVFQQLSVEWAYRLISEPKRMWRRYLVDGPRVFMLAARYRRPTTAAVSRSGTRMKIMGSPERTKLSDPERRPLISKSIAAVIFGLLLAVGVVVAVLLLGSSGSGNLKAQSGASVQQQLSQRSAVLDLPPPDLFRPLTPQDAQVANAERPLVQRRDDPALGFRLTGDAVSRLRAIDCLTQAIYYEAASEGLDGGRAVAQVVLNRVRHPAYPNSVCGVIYQGSERTTGCQFSFTCDGSLAKIPEGYLWARSRLLASQALASQVFAPVGHATHYHANYVLPYWADSLDKMAVVGRHIFYRLRGRGGSKGAFSQRYAVSEPAPPLPPPSLELIDPQAGAVVANSADTSISLLPKVEADRVEALEVAQKIDNRTNVPLQADLSRGHLVLGEPPPETKQKSKSRPPAECRTDSAAQIKPLGADDFKAATGTPGC